MTWSRFGMRRVVVASLAMGCAALAITGTAPVANAAVAPSPSGDIAVVTINALQLTVDEPRLSELALALGTRVGTTPTAPDVVVVEEISQRGLALLRDQLATVTGASYAGVGLTAEVAAKVLLNTSTMHHTGGRSWPDVCDQNRLYQLITAREKESGRDVAVAGIRFAPVHSETSGSDECRLGNTVELREQMAPYADRGTVLLGDFNKRPTVLETECDPEETSGPSDWYGEMTATINGHSYVDAVRATRRAADLTMSNQWTYENKTATTLCDGRTAVRQYRLDYVFANDTVTPIAASADDPGWGSTTPGQVGCTPTPSCKYSDHRFVWAQLRLPTVATHVHDLDASAKALATNSWRASVSVRVLSSTEQPVAGVTVSGRWSTAIDTSQTCVTDAAGWCTVVKNVPKSMTSVRWTVTNLRSAGTTYIGPNHDPDLDSNGTTITVNRG